MFSGVISSIGMIESATRQGDMRVRIACDIADATIGESIAVNGVCLTVVEKNMQGFSVDVSAETLARTAPRWEKGQQVNLERSLKLGDRLDGHLVSGHVDGMAIIKDITASEGSYILCLEAPEPLSRFVAEKGSVTLDGVSLTVNKVENGRFWVNIIPHTWKTTTLGNRKSGDGLNFEVDMMARYVERLLGTKH